MKNLLVLLMMTMVISCNSTRKEFASSSEETKPVFAKANGIGGSRSFHNKYDKGSVSPMINAKFYDSLDQKNTLAQMEMFNKIEQDKAASFSSFKKSMKTKVYTSTIIVNADSSLQVAQDTVYTIDGSWYSVQ